MSGYQIMKQNCGKKKKKKKTDTKPQATVGQVGDEGFLTASSLPQGNEKKEKKSLRYIGKTLLF